MSTERHKETFRKIIEAINTGNYEELPALFAPDYVEHQFGLKKGVEGMKQDFDFLRRAFPDLHLTIEALIADEDTVWGRMTARGTNLGPLWGPSTGKPMEITVYDTLRFRDDLVVDHWGVPDRFAQFLQLGILTKPVPTT